MYRNRSVIRSSRAIKKRRKKRVLRIVAICTCSVVVFFSLAYLSFSPSISIVGINIKGNTSVSSEEIKKEVDTVLSEKYLSFFSKRNKWLYPKNDLIEKIKNDFPQVASVSLSREETQDLLVYIDERNPFGVWCGDAELKKCYFLDEYGFVFGSAPQFTGNVYTIFTGIIESEDPVRQSFLSQPDFIKLQNFVVFLKSFGFKPNRIHLSPSGDGYVLLPSGGKILFTFGPDIDKSIDNLSAFISEKKVVKEDGGLKGQYIDIRFGNKIFYKE